MNSIWLVVILLNLCFVEKLFGNRGQATLDNYNPYEDVPNDYPDIEKVDNQRTLVLPPALSKTCVSKNLTLEIISSYGKAHDWVQHFRELTPLETKAYNRQMMTDFTKIYKQLKKEIDNNITLYQTFNNLIQDIKKIQLYLKIYLHKVTNDRFVGETILKTYKFIFTQIRSFSLKNPQDSENTTNVSIWHWENIYNMSKTQKLTFRYLLNAMQGNESSEKYLYNILEYSTDDELTSYAMSCRKLALRFYCTHPARIPDFQNNPYPVTTKLVDAIATLIAYDQSKAATNNHPCAFVKQRRHWASRSKRNTTDVSRLPENHLEKENNSDTNRVVVNTNESDVIIHSSTFEDITRSNNMTIVQQMMFQYLLRTIRYESMAEKYFYYLIGNADQKDIVEYVNASRHSALDLFCNYSAEAVEFQNEEFNTSKKLVDLITYLILVDPSEENKNNEPCEMSQRQRRSLLSDKSRDRINSKVARKVAYEIKNFMLSLKQKKNDQMNSYSNGKPAGKPITYKHLNKTIERSFESGVNKTTRNPTAAQTTIKDESYQKKYDNALQTIKNINLLLSSMKRTQRNQFNAEPMKNNLDKTLIGMHKIMKNLLLSNDGLEEAKQNASKDNHRYKRDVENNDTFEDPFSKSKYTMLSDSLIENTHTEELSEDNVSNVSSRQSSEFDERTKLFSLLRTVAAEKEKKRSIGRLMLKTMPDTIVHTNIQSKNGNDTIMYMTVRKARSVRPSRAHRIQIITNNPLFVKRKKLSQRGLVERDGYSGRHSVKRPNDTSSKADIDSEAEIHPRHNQHTNHNEDQNKYQLAYQILKHQILPKFENWTKMNNAPQVEDRRNDSDQPELNIYLKNMKPNIKITNSNRTGIQIKFSNLSRDLSPNLKKLVNLWNTFNAFFKPSSRYRATKDEDDDFAARKPQQLNIKYEGRSYAETTLTDNENNENTTINRLENAVKNIPNNTTDWEFSDRNIEIFHEMLQRDKIYKANAEVERILKILQKNKWEANKTESQQGIETIGKEKFIETFVNPLLDEVDVQKRTINQTTTPKVNLYHFQQLTIEPNPFFKVIMEPYTPTHSNITVGNPSGHTSKYPELLPPLTPYAQFESTPIEMPQLEGNRINDEVSKIIEEMNSVIKRLHAQQRYKRWVNKKELVNFIKQFQVTDKESDVCLDSATENFYNGHKYRVLYGKKNVIPSSLIQEFKKADIALLYVQADTVLNIIQSFMGIASCNGISYQIEKPLQIVQGVLEKFNKLTTVVIFYDSNPDNFFFKYLNYIEPAVNCATFIIQTSYKNWNLEKFEFHDMNQRGDKYVECGLKNMLVQRIYDTFSCRVEAQSKGTFKENSAMRLEKIINRGMRKIFNNELQQQTHIAPLEVINLAESYFNDNSTRVRNHMGKCINCFDMPKRQFLDDRKNISWLGKFLGQQEENPGSEYPYRRFKRSSKTTPRTSSVQINYTFIPELTETTKVVNSKRELVLMDEKDENLVSTSLEPILKDSLKSNISKNVKLEKPVDLREIASDYAYGDITTRSELSDENKQSDIEDPHLYAENMGDIEGISNARIIADDHSTGEGDLEEDSETAAWDRKRRSLLRYWLKNKKETKPSKKALEAVRKLSKDLFSQSSGKSSTESSDASTDLNDKSESTERTSEQSRKVPHSSNKHMNEAVERLADEFPEMANETRFRITNDLIRLVRGILGTEIEQDTNVDVTTSDNHTLLKRNTYKTPDLDDKTFMFLKKFIHKYGRNRSPSSENDDEDFFTILSLEDGSNEPVNMSAAISKPTSIRKMKYRTQLDNGDIEPDNVSREDRSLENTSNSMERSAEHEPDVKENTKSDMMEDGTQTENEHINPVPYEALNDNKKYPNQDVSA